MVKAAPSAAFIMSEPDLLLELLVVAFDAPAQLGEIDQTLKGDVLRQGREPIAGRLVLAFRPLDQQPLVRTRRVPSVIIMGGPHPDSGETRAKPTVRALAPADCSPSLFRQAERERLDRDRLVRAVPAQPGWPPAVSDIGLGRQRLETWRPYGGRRGNAGHITHAERADPGAQLRIATVSPVHQSHTTRNAGRVRGLQLIERNRGFGFEHHVLGHAGLLAPRPVLG